MISSIIKELNLDECQITNIYNYGSWVYGTNHEKSDRDFLFVIRPRNRREARPLRFRYGFDYFHEFDLRRLNGFDVTIHSCENFEVLLKKHYMLAVECVFYPDEFILKNEIDFKTIYLSKYYDPLRLKRVSFYEYSHSIDSLGDYIARAFKKLCRESEIPMTINQFICDALHEPDDDEYRMLKNLFHGLRYLDFAEQLVRTKSIEDFRGISAQQQTLKKIYMETKRNWNLVVDYLNQESLKYRKIFNELVPNTDIEDNFKIFVFFDKKHENFCLEKSLKICGEENSREMFFSFYRRGKYPEIIGDVEQYLVENFPENFVRNLKIECPAENEKVPQDETDKDLFWENDSTYFELVYKMSDNFTAEQIKSRSFTIDSEKFSAAKIFQRTATTSEENFYLLWKFSRLGKRNFLRRKPDPTLSFKSQIDSSVKKKYRFVVFDSRKNFDESQQTNFVLLADNKPSFESKLPKIRFGFKNRKFPRSS